MCHKILLLWWYSNSLPKKKKKKYVIIILIDLNCNIRTNIYKVIPLKKLGGKVNNLKQHPLLLLLLLCFFLTLLVATTIINDNFEHLTFSLILFLTCYCWCGICTNVCTCMYVYMYVCVCLWKGGLLVVLLISKEDRPCSDRVCPCNKNEYCRFYSGI